MKHGEDNGRPEAEFSIVLPREDNSGRKIKTEKIKPYIRAMIGRFRGVTTQRVVGCYVDKKTKKVQCEESYKLSSVVVLLS